MEAGEDNVVLANIPTDAIPLTDTEILLLLPVKYPRNVTKSPSLKQFQLLARNDRRRLITINSRGKSFNVTHFCIHCLKCIFISWKKTSYDSNKAEYHLKKHCNKAGKASIQQRITLLEVRKENEHNNLLNIQQENSVIMGQRDIAPVVQSNSIRTFIGNTSYEHQALNAQCH